MENNQFITTELANRIDRAKNQIIKLYKVHDRDADAEKLINLLKQIEVEEKVRVVFIGQYTAGKSTIISALTGNSSIVIDSNISTCYTADYAWDSVVLTDTPGLYTENPEHDARTIEMIRKADLLIYCITSDLFNQYTLADFQNLAFTKNFVGKMFMVINKMSKEDGTYDLLRENYTMSLNRALQPHSISELPYAFVDAKDFRDGKRDNDTELISYSHFEVFIEQLNRFIHQKGLLGRMDKPIMIMKSSIDQVTEDITNDDTHRAFTSLLTHIERKVDQQRSRLDIDARAVIRRELRTITDVGYDLSRKVGIEELHFTEDDLNDLVHNTCETINQQLAVLCEEAVVKLNEEIEEVMNSRTAEYFFNSISGSYSEKGHLFESKEAKARRIQFNSIKSIIESVTGKTVSLAKNGTDQAGFFIKAAGANGGQLHSAVYTVGKFLGHNFKPWEAVNIAKNIGNVAIGLGAVVGVVGAALDVKGMIDDANRADQVQKKQIEFRESFIQIASDLEYDYNQQIGGLFDVYTDITDELQQKRENVEKVMRSDDDMSRKLLEIRNDLVDIQKELF